MKVKIDIDCTPEETRAFFGLPDLGPLHKEMLSQMQEQMRAAMANLDPEAMMKAWMPGGSMWGFADTKKK
jgi:hypothetical protein